MYFTIDLKDWDNHYFIEETDNKFYVFKVQKDSLESITNFDTVVEAINYALLKLGREKEL